MGDYNLGPVLTPASLELEFEALALAVISQALLPLAMVLTVAARQFSVAGWRTPLSPTRGRVIW